MKQRLTVTDILNSVEFELMQHTLLQDDVADGIQRLRAYQLQTRNELLSHGKNPSLNAVIDAQFNTTEMLLTLLQVIDQRCAALQQDLRRAAFAQQHGATPTGAAPAEGAQPDDAQEGRARGAVAPALTSLPAAMTPAAMHFDDAPFATAALDAFITDEPALLEMDVRQSQTPVLGGLVNRVRRELHELVLFYANKVVRQQAEVNRTYGNALQELVAASQAQAWEIQELRAQLLQLTAGQPTVATRPHDDISPAT